MTDVIEMAHGAGGRTMAGLIEQVFRPAFDNRWLDQAEDHAALAVPEGRLAMTTDTYVISPLFFPGGDIGSLAVHGTINDLATAGAQPLYLSAGFVIEEGFPLGDLREIVNSMAAAARAADVAIVTGDTKVVERGKGDRLFVNTTGLGLVPEQVELSTGGIRPGDVILVSGSLGDHGVAILSKRSGLSFESEIESDSAALHGLVARMIAAAPGLRTLRDPTRGGLAAVLNEIAQSAGIGMRIRETDLPIRDAVRGACELLGLDPLNVANEGKMVAFCDPLNADALLQAMRDHPLGRDATAIGVTTDDPNKFVELETCFGGRRVVDWIAGEQLPRIC